MSEIKNLNKAATRIKQAIKRGENIILFSDADLDGVASLVCLQEAIKTLGGRIALCYFPDRQKQGYGLTVSALKALEKYAPALLILSDSGIANVKEIARAKQIGFSVIVIDHHEILNNQLPPADIIVDPKQEGDDYPLKQIASCGLCFKIAERLLSKALSPQMRQNLLQIVALGTLADMVPEKEDNLLLIEEGLPALLNSLRPGLLILSQFFAETDVRRLAQKIIPILQLSDFRNGKLESYLLLSAQDVATAQQLAKEMLKKNEQRHQLIQSFSAEIIEMADSALPFVLESNPDIPHLLTGSIASKICHKLKKPCFVITKNEAQSRGSVRSPKGVNCLQALVDCRDLLSTYGGHPQASGFSIKTENIDKFEKCLEKHFSK